MQSPDELPFTPATRYRRLTKAEYDARKNTTTDFFVRNLEKELQQREAQADTKNFSPSRRMSEEPTIL